MKYKRLVVTFRIPKYGLIKCLVAIKDGYAVSSFKNPLHAKELYDAEIKGGANVKLRGKLVIQKYPDKTQEEILNKIQTELKKAGGKYTVQKVKI